MAATQIDTVIRHFRRSVMRHDRANWTDGQLLARFVDEKDEAAFEALVCRHGRMVFGVCRRVIGNHHDAEDSFQATFLVLARKAATVIPRERLVNWLHGVALRTAMKAKTIAAKRRGREQQVTEAPEPEAAEQRHWHDLRPLLDRELNGLPENYRLPILLCDLDGRTIKDAAQQLGWPQGTLAGRLFRGRKLLANRLARRGVVLSVDSLATVVSQNAAPACVPISLFDSTVKAGMMVAAGQVMVAGMVPAKVAALTEGVLKAMLLCQIKNVSTILFIAFSVVAFGGWFEHQSATGQRVDPKARPINEAPIVGAEAETKVRDGINQKVKECYNQDAAKTDLDRLQGIWSVVSIEQGGKPAKLEKVVFMVDGKRACWQTSDYDMQGGLYLETSRDPKTYDFVTSTRTIEGIYSLDGDTLRLCQSSGTEAKRPVGFATEKASEQLLFVLKRTHGPEVFPFRLRDGTRAFPPVIETDKKAPLPPQETPAPKDSNKYDLDRSAPGNEKPPAKDSHATVKDELTGKLLFGTSPNLNEEVKKLQGTWRRVGGFHGEDPNVPGVANGEVIKNTSVIIDGNEWIGWTSDGKKKKVEFRVDTSESPEIKNDWFSFGLIALGLRADAVKAPKCIDIKEVGGGYVHGIYGLAGNDLVIRLLPGGKQGRPTQFAMTVEDGVLLFFKRNEP